MPSELTGIDVSGLGSNVRAWMSTRVGGVSQTPYDSLNLGRSSGDDPEAVAENRRRVARHLGTPLVWLHQVHGARCVEANADAPAEQADASVATTPDRTLAIMVADCLPVLLSSVDANDRAVAVAGAHAGWRGLAGGVLEAAVQALRARAPEGELCAWLGPCIGPEAFEVGAEVRAAFPGGEPHFRFAPRPDGDPRWRAHLQGLAMDRLQRLGVARLQREAGCTVSEASRFFSFRRDGARSGRMAAFIRLLP